ncbi:Flagellum-specific ATP synthase FliI [Pseudomonas synxantha]|uniref:protein-secreting ATPase n=1 Tax=Pseudomonas synxantha TaxID=47883 RepID=A0A3G7UEA7_9PSED|nr:FliI/YscN family ATPase [Pseudomonas synxantha]AZE56872.1 Flagellum-specific ATP synthase FliI [Pseudomonas synxantha]
MNSLAANKAVEDWRQRQLTHWASYSPAQWRGRVHSIQGILLSCRLPRARVGELCHLLKACHAPVLAEVIGFEENQAQLCALGHLEGIAVGDAVVPLGHAHRLQVGPHLLGQVLDGFGTPLSAKIMTNPRASENWHAVIGDAPLPTERPPLRRPLLTGIRAIDGPNSLAEGQRVGLFAGPGCGKTVLLAELARNIRCDTIVFGLIGERGRELREFLDHELDTELRQRSIIVCATSDRSSMERARAAFTATTVAEGLRDQGQHVLLLIDSLTRFVRAQREIGLAMGEPLGRSGLPASVYTLLPRLIERAGKTAMGTITAFYTVLIEGDTMRDPIADEARSLLDGHLILSRNLAEQGHFPAIDVLASLSRLQSQVVSQVHVEATQRLRRLLNAYQQVEFVLRLGEYQSGGDVLTDLAVDTRPAVLHFLRQVLRHPSTGESTLEELLRLTNDVPN